MDLFSGIPSLQRLERPAIPTNVLEPGSSLAVDSDQEFTLPPITCYSAQIAAENEPLVRLVSTIFNESFGFRPDGKPYRMGPKSLTERFLETDYLLVAGDERSGIGYLFGKEIPSSQGSIAWIESMAVLPLYRRNSVATSLVRCFHSLTRMSPRFGFATPNPIAALIATREVPGKAYIGSCYPPYTLSLLLKEIRQNCFDLRGCHIDEEHFRIRTGFSPLSRSDQREWAPRKPLPEPLWWKSLQYLPNEFEALLVIEK
jgi:hypothetical protein